MFPLSSGDSYTKDRVSIQNIDWMWDDVMSIPAPKKSKLEIETEKKLAIKLQRKNRLRYKEIKKQDLLRIQLEKDSGEEMWFSSRNGIPE